MSPRPASASLLARGAALPLALLAACGGGEPAPPAPEGPRLPPFELRDVVDAALASLPPRPEPGPLDEESAELLEGLVTMVSSNASMLGIARDDVARVGPPAQPRLAGIAADDARGDDERAAALDLVDAASAVGARELLALAKAGEPAWVRARAAYRLAENGEDLIVPDLALRLKYETDHTAVVWMAAAVARHDNLAGLEGLLVVAGDEASPARELAAYELGRLLARYPGADGEPCTVADLARLWDLPATERGWPTGPRSEEYRREVLSWIARLNEFQLRGVDDARFVLERLDADAARELGAALHDDDVYVRVHAAQCLRRMGRRGEPAGAELVAALAEPELAPHAAAALGGIGHAPAAPVLVALLEAPVTEPGLRLACARALGGLPSLAAGEAHAVLGPLLDAEPLELAQAAAESLLARDPGARDVVLRLAALLEDPRADPGSTERALRAWLVEREGGAGEGGDALERWDALAPPADRAETPEEARGRRALRAALARELSGA